jgi:predicted Fe-Mo cluster-binding NifX family protein
MKIAITATSAGLESEVDPRFGRAAFILIVDPQTLDCEVLDNKENVNAFKGAGIQAACMICDQGAEVLLTGYCGPKAFTTLKAAEIKVVNDVAGTVREAIQAFNEGKLKYSDEPNTDGHW